MLLLLLLLLLLGMVVCFSRRCLLLLELAGCLDLPYELRIVYCCQLICSCLTTADLQQRNPATKHRSHA
jgi:hypothetical protein